MHLLLQLGFHCNLTYFFAYHGGHTGEEENAPKNVALFLGGNFTQNRSILPAFRNYQRCSAKKSANWIDWLHY